MIKPCETCGAGIVVGGPSVCSGCAADADRAADRTESSRGLEQLSSERAKIITTLDAIDAGIRLLTTRIRLLHSLAENSLELKRLNDAGEKP